MLLKLSFVVVIVLGLARLLHGLDAVARWHETNAQREFDTETDLILADLDARIAGLDRDEGETRLADLPSTRPSATCPRRLPLARAPGN